MLTSINQSKILMINDNKWIFWNPSWFISIYLSVLGKCCYLENVRDLQHNFYKGKCTLCRCNNCIPIFENQIIRDVHLYNGGSGSLSICYNTTWVQYQLPVFKFYDRESKINLVKFHHCLDPPWQLISYKMAPTGRREKQRIVLWFGKTLYIL